LSYAADVVVTAVADVAIFDAVVDAFVVVDAVVVVDNVVDDDYVGATLCLTYYRPKTKWCWVWD